MLTKRKDIQDELIVATLDELVPSDHLVRKLDKLDYSFIYDEVTHFYSKEGRPSIDPIVLFKILVIKYFFSITTLSQTLKDIEVNMAYRWYLKMRLTDKLPSLSVISRNINRRFKENHTFEDIFDRIIENALQEKIITKKELKFDSYINKKFVKRKKTQSLYESTLV